MLQSMGSQGVGHDLATQQQHYVPGTVLNAGSSTRLNKGPTFRCCCSEQPKAQQNPRTSAGGNRCEETGSAAGYEEGVGTERVPEEPPG